MSKSIATINYKSVVLLIECVNSNPNGDPAAEGAPRRANNGFGEISAVSVKRKIRDLIINKDGAFWRMVAEKYNLDPKNYDCIETSDTKEKEVVDYIAKNKEDGFFARFWDARVFGTTFIPAGNGAAGVKTSGVFAFGEGMTTHPITISGQSLTRAREQSDGKKTFANDAKKFVEYAIYTMGISIIPDIARKNKVSAVDCQIVLDALTYLYQLTPSASRPSVTVLHAWAFDHGRELPIVHETDLVSKLSPKTAVAGVIPVNREGYKIETPESLGLVGPGKKFAAEQVSDLALGSI